MHKSWRETQFGVDRRTFLRAGLTTTLIGGAIQAWRQGGSCSTLASVHGPAPPAYSIIPVVGDGKWVWTEPPNTIGYLDPREFDLTVGIQMSGTGVAVHLQATTPVPLNYPEQTILAQTIQTQGCQAIMRQVGDGARQLVLRARSISRNQTIAATATFRLTLLKQFMGHGADRFPVEQPPVSKLFRKQFLFDSPGIESRLADVRKLREQLCSGRDHPWHWAEAFHEWVWHNIEVRIGNMTSVRRALRDRAGDCEERAAIFVALCRSAGIPAGLVWVPNHNWAEFYLVDHEGEGHWIPAHTAAYSWFGWTGVHELVIQKGDRIYVPEKQLPQRLMHDWAQWSGAKPRLRFFAELQPVPLEPGDEIGPGTRSKNSRGEWEVRVRHPLDRELRDGSGH